MAELVNLGQLSAPIALSTPGPQGPTRPQVSDPTLTMPFHVAKPLETVSGFDGDDSG